MADYYPLIARAVAGLEQNTGETRRTLYERARGALVAQLRSVEPALNESDITHERLALEEAIRRVEAEAARRSRPDFTFGEEAPASATPAVPADASEPPHAPAAPAWDDGQPSLRDQGLKGFRDVVQQAEGLGDAAAAARRSARDFYDTVPGESDRAEPTRRFEPPPHEQIMREPGARDHDIHDRSLRDHLREAVPDQGFGRPSDEFHPGDLSHDDRPHDGPHDDAVWPPPSPSYEDLVHRPMRPARSYRGLVRIVLLLLIVSGVAAGGYWKRHDLVAMVKGMRSAPSTQTRDAAPASPAARPKIADRIGPAGEIPAQAPATAPAAAVAQKVVLFDEDPSDPKGKRYVGSALWRTETVSPGPGLAPELAVRADVEIPERGIRMTWSLRRNTDKALPASHTIEILFTLPADFVGGGVSNIPGVLMKQDEQARGVPLAGLAVKVTSGYFLIGLSAVDVDLQRNIQMLKERDWFDIPIVYDDGRRAILAMEKGTPGLRAFEEAFRAWGQ